MDANNYKSPSDMILEHVGGWDHWASLSGRDIHSLVGAKVRAGDAATLDLLVRGLVSRGFEMHTPQRTSVTLGTHVEAFDVARLHTGSHTPSKSATHTRAQTTPAPHTTGRSSPTAAHTQAAHWHQVARPHRTGRQLLARTWQRQPTQTPECHCRPGGH